MGGTSGGSREIAHGEISRAGSVRHRRTRALSLIALPWRAPAAAQQPTLGQSDRELGEGAAAAQGAQPHHQGRGTIPDTKSVQPRAAGRPRLAPVPRGDAALDRRHRHPRHAGRCWSSFYLIRGMVKLESGRSGRTHRALQRVRALRALDDGDLLHHPGASPVSTSPSASRCCCR